MANELSFSGFITLDLSDPNPREKDIVLSLGLDGTEPYQNLLVYRIFWDTSGPIISDENGDSDEFLESSESTNEEFNGDEEGINGISENCIYLTPYSLEDKETVTQTLIYNFTGHYETPEGALYQQVIIPPKARGYFTFYYNVEQAEDITETDDSIIDVVTFGSDDLGVVGNLLYYDTIFSIRFEVIDFNQPDTAKFVKMGDLELSLKDNRPRTYYYPNSFYPLHIGAAIQAHVYGQHQKAGETL